MFENYEAFVFSRFLHILFSCLLNLQDMKCVTKFAGYNCACYEKKKVTKKEKETYKNQINSQIALKDTLKLLPT